MAGLAGYESLITVFTWCGLFIAEFFLPGGIAGIIGLALIIGSLIFAGGNVIHMGVSCLIALIIAIVGMVILMKFFGKNLKLFNKIVLTDATDTELGYVSNVNRY